MSKHDEYVAQIERILEKLGETRVRQPTCYGSDSHGFKLHAPLSEAEVELFESSQSIQLPEDYRLFLTRIGDGGAGPYNGIFPLSDWDDFAGWVIDEPPTDLITLPCPMYPGMARTKDWIEKLSAASPFEVSPYQGTLSLGSQGCTYAMQLIVSGPCRGRVVYVNADHTPPYVVHEPDFLSWYERWLDELLQGYNFGWFGYGPGGGEDDFFDILSDPLASDDFRTEAAFSFCRLPRLSDNAASHIANYLDDTFPGVRSGALATIQKFQLNGLLSQAAQKLEDQSAEVRKQAVKTVMALDPQGSIEEVHRRLREDDDQEVLFAAFHALKEIGALTKTELLRMLGDPGKASLHGQVASAIQWSTDDETVLIGLLTDSDKYVRIQAVLGLKLIVGKSSLPNLIALLSTEQDVGVVRHLLKTLGEFGETSSVPVLLDWTKSLDDFYRLDALEALTKIGDERAVEPALAMLQEQRQPIRRDPQGFSTHARTISELVRSSLRNSPNPALRQLAG